jgi:DNA-binding NarL/FixJ family response regulator
MLGHAQSTDDIAATLSRSVKTIETYRSRIKQKLGLRNTIELAQVAWQFVHGVGVGSGSIAQ